MIDLEPDVHILGHLHVLHDIFYRLDQADLPQTGRDQRFGYLADLVDGIADIQGTAQLSLRQLSILRQSR